MKKIAIILSGALLAFGCSEEDSNNIAPPSQVNLNKNPETVDEVTSQVISFLDEIDNENVNDRNKEDALFILEAALNYNYRRPIDDYSEFKEGQTTDLQLQINDEDIVDGASLASEHERIKSLIDNSLDENEVVELIDLSNALDSNGVEQLRAIIVIGQSKPGQYFLTIGDWKALANVGNCAGTITTGDAAGVTASVYNYKYRNNSFLSSVNQNGVVYYSGIKVTGSQSTSGRYPFVIPDLWINSQPEDSNGNPTKLGDFKLVGSSLDNLHPNPLAADCVLESEINTYVSRINADIYDISPAPSSQKEPFNVQLETLFLLAPGAPGHHHFHAVYFGDPHTL